MRRSLGLMALIAGCGWTLPEPDVRRDATPAADARRDVAAPTDAVAPVDAEPIVDTPPAVDAPVAMDAGFDAGRADSGFDAPVAMDAGEDRPMVLDLGVADVPVDRGVVVDVPMVLDVPVDTGEVRCAPGERRSCYPGPPASRGRGYCRDGVETCDPSGRWSGTCVNAFVPDCTDRRCGSDDCGGTCGPGCAAGQVCDDLGHCVVPSCGAGNFTETCSNGALCPSNSLCTADNLCACRPGYVGRTCAGADCGTSCAYPNWYCARSSFCGTGAISCPGSITCPRHSTCAAGGQCICAFGYMAVTCSGDRCTACPGTDYHCVPVS
ncbi:MAG: hypothetical protein IPF99_17875 [Deltaproteobacteria bacterium]|nr:hypothetical protein [Deltaproteobacteria bacterium]